MADIFLFSIASKRGKSGQKIRSLKNVLDVTDLFIKENILLANAWSGCNTTSSTCGNGNSTMLKYLKENKEVREINQIFTDSSASHLEILEAGIRLFLLMYGAKQATLNMHRYITYTRLNYSSKSQVKPEKLPLLNITVEYQPLNITVYEYIVTFFNGKMKTILISHQHIGDGKITMELLSR